MNSKGDKISYKQVLIQVGLNESQSVVYETLLNSGALRASSLAVRTPFKRQLTYKILDELVGMGLVIKDENRGKVAVFEPAHPQRLKQLAEEREKQARQSQDIIDGVLHTLTSTYNLSVGKPGVSFFEGKEGIIKLYELLLDNGTNIDSFEDKGEMVSLFPEYVPKWIDKRIKRKIPIRTIAPVGNSINKPDPNSFRDARFIPNEHFPFRMDIKTTGTLTSLITFQKENPIGVLIDNQEIADNFKILFELIWKKLEPSSSN